MRLLIIGASGLVGSHVLAEASARGHTAQGTYRNHPLPDLERLDLMDESGTRGMLISFRPDWVVHAAGWTWVDGCEQDKARAFDENCKQPVRLAAMSKQVGARFAYFSTTYVFDGTQGPYTETDVPNPINTYGRSKWEAEKAIQETMAGEALIPRVICVWGRETQEKNFVYQSLNALRDRRRLRLPSDQLGNPTWAGDIAWWLLGLIEAKESGVWNLAGDSDCALRIEWFRRIWQGARTAGIDCDEFDKSYEGVPTVELGQAALRPLNAVACTKKLRTRFPYRRSTSPDNISKIFYT